MAYIGTSPSNGVRKRFVYVATANQQTFSGNDENGISLVYVDVAYLDVYQNGVKLKAVDDYASTTGTTVVLVQGASADDIVEIIAYDVFSVADTVSAGSGGNFGGNVGMGGTLAVTGNTTVGGTLGVTGVATFTETPTYATAKDPFNSIIETWYYDNTDTSHANNAILTRGYTRLTTNATANKNGGMAHATAAGTGGSGIWTFPSTGIWRVELHLSFIYSGAALANGIIIQITTNNSSYVDVHGLLNHGAENNANQNIILPYVLNVSNTTNVKFKHKISSGNNITIKGNGEVFDTKINFIKLSN